MNEAVIVSGARTAVGSFGGALKGVKAVDLGALAVGEAIRRAGLRPVAGEEVEKARPDALKGIGMTELNKRYDRFAETAIPVYFDECIMGNVLQAGHGQNPARQAGIFAGLP